MISRLAHPHQHHHLHAAAARSPALYYYLTTAACLTLSYITLRRLLSSSSAPAPWHDADDPSSPTPPTSIPSPLRTLIPRLTPSHRAGLPYPPESPNLPGRRDVATPYGSIRAYEFGPAEPAARRVLLLHGISTPCVSLLPVARLLADEHGCRVCLFDLFGRGYSDAPADSVPYDGRLYASQVQFVVNSSPVGGWQRFTLVGYSLGGGLAVDYASWCPEQVQEVVSIAGGGLVRRADVSLRSKVLYSQGWVPESWLRAAVKRRLRGPARPEGEKSGADDSDNDDGQQGGRETTKDVVDAIRQEVPKAKNDGTEGVTAAATATATATAPAAQMSPFDIERVVAWQLDNHDGFVQAYMSSIRHAPIHDQHHRWSVVGRRQQRAREMKSIGRKSLREGEAKAAAAGFQRNVGESEDEKEEAAAAASAFDSTRLLLIFGADDPLVKAAEILPDARGCMRAPRGDDGEGDDGDDNDDDANNVVAAHVVAGAGHEVVMTHARECVEAMVKHWNGGGGGRGTK